MTETGSITVKWLPDFKAGNEEAANELVQRFFQRIVRLARKRLDNMGAPRRVEDEEDVAVSVFRQFCGRVQDRRLQKLKRTDELWALLVKITGDKVTDLVRRQSAKKRGNGEVRGESVFQKAGGASDDTSGLQGYIGEDLPPEADIVVAEVVDRLLKLLPDETIRSMAKRYLQGHRASEIARELAWSRQKVHRKLDLILAIWRKAAADE